MRSEMIVVDAAEANQMFVSNSSVFSGRFYDDDAAQTLPFAGSEPLMVFVWLFLSHQLCSTL